MTRRHLATLRAVIWTVVAAMLAPAAGTLAFAH
jgi:hypothetical protein